MTKKRLTQVTQDNTPDYLVKSRIVFEKELDDRIRIGSELLQKPLTNNLELGQLSNDYSFWHDFKSELLKRAFDKTTNQYLKDYTSFPAFYVTSIGGFERAPTLQESIDKVKGNVSKYLTRLQKIWEKLVLIDELPGLIPPEPELDVQSGGLAYLHKLFAKFHKVVLKNYENHLRRIFIIDVSLLFRMQKKYKSG